MTSSPQEIYKITIRDMPEGERPRERLENHGETALSNAELLAILLRTGTQGENVINLSNRLLMEFGGVLGLSRAGFNELSSMRGIGRAKTCQLKAALELGRRLLLSSPSQRPQVTSPADTAALLMLEMGNLEQEHLRTVLLDTKNYVLGIPTIYKGNINTTVIRIAEVFRPAIRENANAIILVHNHPSGDPQPSMEDVQVTKRLIKAGKLIDIEILDHVIIGHQQYLSFKEKGQIFKQLEEEAQKNGKGQENKGAKKKESKAQNNTGTK